MDIPLTATQQYAYVFAVDFAGNVSSPFELILPATDLPPEDVPQKWPVYTTAMTVGGSDGNVYKATGYPYQVGWSGSGTLPVYYVRADGETPFRISAAGWNSAQAADAQFLLKNLVYNVYNATAIGDGTPHQAFRMNMPDAVYNTWKETTFDTPYYGSELLQDYLNPSYMRKQETTQKVSFTQQGFTLDVARTGQLLYVYPEANAEVIKTKEVIKSEIVADKKNGVVIMPDGEGPDIDDTEILELLKEYTDNTISQENKYPYTFEIPVSDKLSGVKADNDGLGMITVTIRNKDNGTTKDYYPEDTTDPNTVKITFKKEDSLFNGDIEIIVTATDNVGNVTTKEYNTGAFGLFAEVEYTDAMVGGTKKHNYFTTEDHGKLKINTNGYVEKLTVTATMDGKDLVDFTDGTNNRLTVSFDNSAADVKEEHPYIDWTKSFDFTIDGKLDEDSEVVFTIKATKGTRETTQVVKAVYLKDTLTARLDGVTSLESTEGIPNVYKADTITFITHDGQTMENTWFVKADGESPFTVDYSILGSQLARKTVQINKFDLMLEQLDGGNATGVYAMPDQENIIKGSDGVEFVYHYIPYNANAEGTVNKEDVATTLTGTNTLTALGEENAFNRVDYAKSVNTKEKFAAPRWLDKKTVQITPRGTMDYRTISQSITTDFDTTQSAFIIADAVGPKWTGDAGLDEKILTPGAPEDLVLDFLDDVSGFNKATITIENTTTGKKKQYTADKDDPTVTITMDPDDEDWIGAAKITITGYDNVGNVTEKTYTVYSFNISAKITTTFRPFTNQFYSGNRAWLWIETWGYVESLDITLPADLDAKYYVYQDGNDLGKLEYYRTDDGTYVLDPNTGTKQLVKHEVSGQTVHIQLDNNPNHYSAHRIDLLEFVIDDRQDLDPEYTVNVIANKHGYERGANPNLYILGYSGDLSRTRLR